MAVAERKILTLTYSAAAEVSATADEVAAFTSKHSKQQQQQQLQQRSTTTSV